MALVCVGGLPGSAGLRGGSAPSTKPKPELAGVGAALAVNGAGRVVFSQMVPGMPAAASGMIGIGDELVAVDGVNVPPIDVDGSANELLLNISRRILGPTGTEVTLLLRPSPSSDALLSESSAPPAGENEESVQMVRGAETAFGMGASALDRDVDGGRGRRQAGVEVRLTRCSTSPMRAVLAHQRGLNQPAITANTGREGVAGRERGAERGDAGSGFGELVPRDRGAAGAAETQAGGTARGIGDAACTAIGTGVVTGQPKLTADFSFAVGGGGSKTHRWWEAAGLGGDRGNASSSAHNHSLTLTQGSALLAAAAEGDCERIVVLLADGCEVLSLFLLLSCVSFCECTHTHTHILVFTRPPKDHSSPLPPPPSLSLS